MQFLIFWRSWRLYVSAYFICVFIKPISFSCLEPQALLSFRVTYFHISPTSLSVDRPSYAYHSCVIGTKILETDTTQVHPTFKIGHYTCIAIKREGFDDEFTACEVHHHEGDTQEESHPYTKGTTRGAREHCGDPVH